MRVVVPTRRLVGLGHCRWEEDGGRRIAGSGDRGERGVCPTADNRIRLRVPGKPMDYGGLARTTIREAREQVVGVDTALGGWCWWECWLGRLEVCRDVQERG